MKRKGGSKILTGILCFLLGIIFTLGAILGVFCYAAFYDLESVLNMVGIDNTDENGDYVYINTGDDGVSNAYELLTTLISYVGDYQNLTMSQLEDLLPATSSLVDTLVDTFSEYVDVDADEFRDGLTNTKVSALGDYISDLITSIRVSTLLEKFADGLLDDSNAAGVLIKAIVYGKEADYVATATGKELPVYYDVYKASGASAFAARSAGGTYVRYTADDNGDYTVNEGTTLQSGAEDYLVAEYTDDGTTVEYYYLYYYVQNDTAYIASYSDDYAATTVAYDTYSGGLATLTGNYYYEDGNMVVVTAITLGYFTESSNITESLNYVSITDLITTDSDDDLITAILGDYTIGDLLSGDIDFDGIELSALIDTAPDNDIMLAIMYSGITNMTDDGNGNWTCDYTDDDGNSHECTVSLDSDGNIDEIYYYENGEKVTVTGTTVGTISSTIDTLTLASVMGSVSPTDGLMAYLIYGVSDVTAVEGEDNLYTGKHELSDGTEVTCYIETKGSGDDEVIVSAYYYDEEGSKVSTATKVNDISDSIDGITDKLTIGDIIEISEDDSEILKKLADYKISEISDAIDDFTLADFMDAETDSAILMYLIYSVTDLTEVEGQDYKYTAAYHYTDEATGEDKTRTCYVVVTTDESGTEIVSRIYYIDETDGTTEIEIEGTKVSEVSGSIDGITETLTIGDIIEITEDDSKIMKKLADYKISEISDAIDDFTLDDFMDADPDSAILMYIIYGVSEIEAVTDTSITAYQYTAKYNYTADDGTDAQKDCYIVTATDGETGEVTVSRVYYIDAENNNEEVEITGTKVSEVSDRIDGLTNTLTVGDIIDVDESDKVMVKLSGYTLNNISDAIDSFTLDDFMDADPDSAILMYIIYGVSEIEAVTDSSLSYQYTAVYNYTDGEGNAATRVCYIVTTTDESTNEEIVSRVYYIDGETEVEITGTKVSEVSDRIDGITDTLTIGDIIDIDENSSNMMKKLENVKIGEISDAIDDFTLDDFIDADPTSAVIMYMVYGVTDLTEVTGQNYQYTASYKDADGNTWVCYIETTGSGENITVSDIYYYDTTSGESVKTTITGTKIADVSDRIDGIMEDLTLGELIEIDDSNTLLKALKSTSINNLSTTIDNLSLQEIFPEDIYGTGATLYKAVSSSAGNGEIVFSANYLYYVYDSETDEYELVDIEGNDLGKLTEAQFTANSGTTYYTYGAPTGTWKFMLCVSDNNGGYNEKAYSINSIGDLMTNTTDNIKSAKLSELQKAGIIDNSVDLTKYLYGTTTALGDFTLAGLMTALTTTTGS